MSGDGRKKEISGIRVLCIFLAFLIIALLLAGVKMIFRTEKSEQRIAGENGSWAEESIIIENPTEKPVIKIKYPENPGNVTLFGGDIVKQGRRFNKRQRQHYCCRTGRE